MRRWAVLVAVAAVVAAVGVPTAPDGAAAAGPVVVERRVGSGADDAEELASGVVTRSSTDLELVTDEGVSQVVGVRFADLGIARGAQIQAAWIQFTADESQSEPTDLEIRAHAVDNAPKLGPNNFNLSSRNPTAASVRWTPPAWSSDQAGAAQRTPDLRALVQEVVDRPWWAGETGALAFTFRGTGHRTAVAHDLDPARAPALHVEWTPGTPAPRDGSIRRFAVIGDYGNGGGDAGKVAELVNRLRVDDVLTVGDNSYSANPIDENIGRFYAPYIGNYRGAYGTGAPTNRFWPAVGNHDYTDGGGLPAYLDYFTLPGNELYYDVVLGPVHAFFVDSNHQQAAGITATSAQAQWLRTGLAASQAPWQVVVLHHPPFSSGTHGNNTALQWPFAEWGVDAVLAGHDHDYERLEADGIPHFVSGAGGVSRYELTTPNPNSVVYDASDDGALLLEACAGRMAFTYHTVSSGVLDTRTVGSSCNGTRVTVEATDPLAHERNMETATFTVRRTGSTASALNVAYTVGGTASPPPDYLTLPGTVTIPKGASSATVTVEPINDIKVEPDETVRLTLAARAGYSVGNPDAATVTIRSDDSATTETRDLYPTATERIFGTTAGGGLASLQRSDNNRLAIREERGPGANPASRVEHRFTLPQLPRYQEVMVVVEGHHTAGGEGDHLLVEWSRGGSWYPLVTVTKTADNGTAQFKLLPGWINEGNRLKLRVRDADRTPGRSGLDTFWLDRLFLRVLIPR